MIFRSCLTCMLMFLCPVASADPGWWSQHLLNPVLSGQPAENKAVVLVGQFKNIVRVARLELEADLPGGAGSELTGLVQQWDAAPIHPDNRKPILIGQAKNITSMVYDRLLEERFIDKYPWTDTPTDDWNSNVLLIGQLKNMFSFEIDVDSDSDGLPDAFERTAFGEDLTLQTGGDDADGDGLTNAVELFETRTDPVAFDTNGRGEPDLLAHDLRVRYAFEEKTGDMILDGSGNGHHGTLLEDASRIPDIGVDRGSIRFISEDDSRIECPKEMLSGVSDATFSFWYKSNASTPSNEWQAAFSGGGFDGASNNYRFLIFFHKGSKYFRVYNGNHYRQWTGIDICDGQWHHVAIVRDVSSGQRLYIDGAPKTQYTWRTGENATINVSGICYLGFRQQLTPGVQSHLIGNLDEFRIYNRHFSDDEVQYLYDTQEDRIHELRDLDSDTLPDWWEIEHFGSLEPRPGDDPDHDNLDNATEFGNLTDPLDPSAQGIGLVNAPTNNLRVLYSFNDRTATDESGNDHHGTVMEKVTPDRGSMKFVSEDDSRIECPKEMLSGVSDATFSFWYKSNANTPSNEWQVAFSGGGFDGASNNYRFLIFFKKGTKQFRVYSGNYYREWTGIDICDGQWHHVAYVRDVSGGHRLYVDGAPKTHYNWRSGENGTINVSGVCYLGYRQTSNPSVQNHLMGSLDEFRIYDVAMSQSEISEIYDAGDTDNDFLPDSWELHYFSDLSQDGTDDLDLDGADNLAEYLAETHPNDSGLAFDLVAHYPMDDGGGHLVTETARGLHGQLTDASLTGASAWLAAGTASVPAGTVEIYTESGSTASGQAALNLWHSGDHPPTSDNYLRIPSEAVNGLHDLTVSSWLWGYFDDPGTTADDNLTRTVFSAEDDDSVNFEITISGSKTLNIKDDTGTFSVTTTNDLLTKSPTLAALADTRWVHLAVSREAGVGYKIYVNGQLDKSVTRSFGRIKAGFSDQSTSDDGVYIGAGSNGTNILRANIDEFSIHNRALAAAEIADLYSDTYDSDGDGLPDGWEMHHFGNLGQPAHGDPDGDGQDNLNEWTNGSDPSPAGTFPSVSLGILGAEMKMPDHDKKDLGHNGSDYGGQEDDSCPTHSLLSRNEASGPAYRKIGWNGYPISDQKPQAKAESDREPDENYIDALNLSLRHDMRDVAVALPNSELVLGVRRSSTSEVWSTHPGLLPHQQIDKPFGLGWSTGLAAHVSIPTYHVDTPDSGCESESLTPPYVTVVDENGGSFQFLPVYKPYDVSLMSVTSLGELPGTGTSEVVIALVNDDLHIRIFDTTGMQVVDKAENEMLPGQDMDDLKDLVANTPANFSHRERRTAIAKASAITGYTINYQYVRYVPVPTNRTEQNAFLMSLSFDANADEYTFTRQFGTTLVYQKVTAPDRAYLQAQVDTNDGMSGKKATVRYARLKKVTDRFGGRLLYQYDSADTIIPDRIVAVTDTTLSDASAGGVKASKPGYRVLTIHKSRHTLGGSYLVTDYDRIDAVTDPNGNTVLYEYEQVDGSFGNRALPGRTVSSKTYPSIHDKTGYFKLTKVTRPDGSRIRYGYEQFWEEDWTPGDPPYKEHRFFHLNINRITNGAGNTHVFTYQRDMTKTSYAASSGNTKYYVSPGQPRIIREVRLPNDARAVFATFKGGNRLPYVKYNGATPTLRPQTSTNAKRVVHVQDADLNQRVYEFSNGKIIDPQEVAVFLRLRPDASSEYFFKRDLLVMWQTLTLTHPDGGQEEFHFNPDAGMKVWKVKHLHHGEDKDGGPNGTPDGIPDGDRPRWNYYHYGDSWNLPSDLGFLQPVQGNLTMFPGKYPEPTVEINAMHGVDYATPAALESALAGIPASQTKQFEYVDPPLPNFPDARILTKTTNERYIATEFTVDPTTGLTTEETVLDIFGGTVQKKTYEYGDPRFPAFRTSSVIEGDDDHMDLVTNYYADDFGNTEITVAGSRGQYASTVSKYDYNGNRTLVVDPNGNPTVTRYDPYNRPTTEVLPPAYDAVSGNFGISTRQHWYDGTGRRYANIDENGNATFFVYDALNRVRHRIRDMDGDAGYSLADRDNPAAADHFTSFTYNNVGSTLSTRDPNGNTSVTYYDALQRVVGELDPEGALTEFRYRYGTTFSGSGALDVGSYIDAGNASGYETNGGSGVFQSSSFQPVMSRDPRGYVSVYAFDNLYRKTAELMQYDNTGDVNDAGGYRITLWEYDPAGNPVTQKARVIETSGAFHDNKTTTDFDQLNRPTTVEKYHSAPSGGGSPALYSQSEMSYSPTGLQWRSVDEEGRETQTVHDALGRAVAVYRPDPDTGLTTGNSPVTHTQYDPAGNTTAVTNARGFTWHNTYDSRNRLIAETSPEVANVDGPLDIANPGGAPVAAPKKTHVYDAVGNRVHTVDARGALTTTEYDAANRAVKSTSPPVPVYGEPAPVAPQRFTYYDKNGNITGVKDENGNATLNKYDARNSLVATKTNPVAALDPADPVALAAADTVVHAQDVVVLKEHDISGNLVALEVTEPDPVNRPGENQRSEFEFDGLDRPTKTSHIDESGVPVTQSEFVYNGWYKEQRIDGRGRKTDYAYDQVGRLVSVTYDTSSAGTLTASEVSFNNQGRTYLQEIALYSRKNFYDKVGNLLAVRRLSATSASSPETDLKDVTHTFDHLDRITSETSAGVKTAYAYDAEDNRTAVYYGYVSPTSYQRKILSGYDALNRLVTCKESQTAGATRTTSYYYDLNSNVTNKALPNAVYEHCTYDALNRKTGSETRKTSWSGPLVQEFATSYDRMSSVRRTVETYPAGTIANRTVTNTYDNVYRLVSENIDRTGSGVSDTLTEYEYDKSNNRTVKIINGVLNQKSFYNNFNQLDYIENLFASKTRIYTYDLNGNQHTRKKSNSNYPDYYVYDYDNRLIRVRKNSQPAPGVYIHTYDHRTRRVQRTDSGGTQRTTLVYSGGLSAQEYVGDTASGSPDVEFIRGSDMGGGVGGMLYSFRGTTQRYAHSNSRGDITARTDSNGAIQYLAGYEAFGTRPSGDEFGTNNDPQRANTKEEDPTGLLNEGFRYRDLETGVFLTRDPAGFIDGPNQYTYVNQNPWSAFDPTGLGAKKIFTAAEEAARAGRKSVNNRKVRIPSDAVPGKTYKLKGELGKKYPDGVPISKDGYPDFSKYAKHRDTKIDGMKGDSTDFTKANREAGLNKTPDGYTWHHNENGTMELVPTDVHGAVAHTGGASIARSAKEVIATTSVTLLGNTMRSDGSPLGVVEGLVRDGGELVDPTMVGVAALNTMADPERHKEQANKVYTSLGLKPVKDVKHFDTSKEQRNFFNNVTGLIRSIREKGLDGLLD